MSDKLRSASWAETIWKTSSKQAALLLMLSLTATALLWTIRSDKLPLIADATYYQLELTAPLVEIPEALVLYELGEHLFVDVRSNELANDKIIPGSFIVRETTLDDDLAANIEFLFPEDKIILYGTGDLMAAANIAARLQKRGFVDLVILKGGLQAWTDANGPVSQRVTDALEDAS